MFSVVIPLYNKELSIKSTIQSVLNQTYQSFEIIIVNDGSTDNSINAVSKIDDARIRLINQTNQGVSAARNRGVLQANNDWIVFLDGDDLWEINHLEKIIEMMTLFPNKKVYATSFKYSDKRTTFKHTRSRHIFEIENYFKDALKENLLWTSIVVVHKDCFEKVGLFDTNINRGEDTDLWVRLASEFKIIKSSTITATYRVDAENRTELSKNLDSTYIYHLELDDIEDFDKKKYFESMIANRLYQYSRSKDFKNFFKLKKRYPSIGYGAIVKYSAIHLYKKVIEIKRKVI
ncbi:glycosyltransferase family 2 protein [Psychrobacter sp. T6-1]|uniref:glycosyltransferase family 2 protein n=1 Tax=Psychrobacter sp. T6-1 TaxID=3457447 RepID=UPI003FD5F03B